MLRALRHPVAIKMGIGVVLWFGAGTIFVTDLADGQLGPISAIAALLLLAAFAAVVCAITDFEVRRLHGSLMRVADAVREEPPRAPLRVVRK